MLLTCWWFVKIYLSGATFEAMIRLSGIACLIPAVSATCAEDQFQL